MAETLLTEPDQKEILSRLYVTALAARAGYLTSVPDPDRDSIDLRIQAGGDYRPALDVQLKATTLFREAQESSKRPFRLSIKNYRDLQVTTQTPRLLIILELPKNREEWISITEQALVLRSRSYWLSLQKNHDEITDQETVTIHIPAKNVLNVETLQDLMEKSRTGEI